MSPETPVTTVHAAGAALVAAPGRTAVQTPLSLSVTSISARTVTPKTRLTLQGTVVNRSGQALTGVYYRLRYSAQHATNRSQLAQWSKGSVTSLAGATGVQALGNVAAGATPVPWRLTVNAKDLGLGVFGSYPIGVEFYTQAGQSLAGQVTFIVWQPAGTKYRKTSIGWVWPLTDRMHRSSDDSFLDDRLETDLAPNGRLGGLVTAAEKTTTPLTWAVDPALLDDAETMTGPKGYVVRPPGKKAAPKPTSATARTWLDRLRNASAGDPYFSLPYADVDADALVRNGLSRHLQIGYKHMGLAEKLLGRPAASKMAWPVPGVSTSKALGRMAAFGSDSFLMNSAVFQPADQTYTPSAPASVQTPVGARPVVTYDPVLSEIVSADTRDPGARLLAEQRFLAETAMITAELPQQARSIVIAPDRRWNPDPAFAENLLRWTDAAPWMKPVQVDRLAKTPAGQRQQFTYTGYPESYPAYELGRKYLGEVRKIATRATGFSTILNPVEYPYERAVLRLESGSWRGSSTTARRARSARDQFGDRLSAEIGKVRPVSDSTIQLAGRTGRISVTVHNGLADRSIRLQVKISSRIPARLQIGEYPPHVRLGPDESASIFVEVESYAQGMALVDVELLTPEGKTYRPRHTLRVNTTGYGPVALLITGGSLAVLFVGVGFRAMRARRRNKMEASGDGPPGGEPAWPDDPADRPLGP